MPRTLLLGLESVLASKMLLLQDESELPTNHHIYIYIYIHIYIHTHIYTHFFFKERVNVNGGGTEGERKRIFGRLHAHGRARHGAQAHHPEIMT